MFNELIKWYSYFHEMMMANFCEDAKRIMYEKLRDYVGSLIKEECENDSSL